MSISSTGWKISGASGLTAKVGTPIANIEVGISYIRLPIEKAGSPQQFMLRGVGGGIGAGLSISTPIISASGSLDQFPASGLGEIIKGAAPTKKNYSFEDFFGEAFVFSLGAGKQISGQLSGVIWLNEPVERCIAELSCSRSELRQIAKNALLTALGATTPVGAVAQKTYSLLKRSKALGSFAGINLESQLIGAGVDIFSYRLST
jgi:hypothetical protein